MTRRYEWPAVVAFLGIAALGDILHCFLLPGVQSWGGALPSLYCIPIVIAAINLGIRAALGVALVSGLSHAAVSLLGCGSSWAGLLIDTVLYIGAAVIVARFSRLSPELAVSGHSSAQPHPPGNLEHTQPGQPIHREPAALSQILAALVNRFRTPVYSIEGAVELLEERRFPEEKRQEFIHIIRKESHQLDRELSDVLDFVQPRKPQCRQVHVPQLLDDVIERIGPQRSPDIHFRKEIARNLPLLTCDPEQIRKMLGNLLMNAVQATPGGGLIAIAVEAESDSIVISIRDPGRGIAPTIAGRVFDPFFTNRENALGLGLTIARQIASSHCGNITVMESSAKGTSVSVKLPLAPRGSHERRSYSGG